MMLHSKKTSPAGGAAAASGGGGGTLPSFPRHSPQSRNDNNSSKMIFSPFRQDNNSTSSSIFTPSPRAEQQQQQQILMEEISVSNLRKLYSSLLEELAPLHHELGTSSNNNNYSSCGANNNYSSNNTNNNANKLAGNKNANFRWKNKGTITVDGTDDTGYDYSYTPDDAIHSWRLGGLRSSATTAVSGNHTSSGRIHPNERGATAAVPKLGLGGVKLGGLKQHIRRQGGASRIKGGITGGDWSKDGVRRYHTGGVTSPTNTATASAADVMRDAMMDSAVNKKEVNSDAADGGVEKQLEKKDELMLVEDTSLDNLQLDERFSIQEDDGNDDEEGQEEENDDEMFDVAILTPVPSTDVEDTHHDNDNEQAILQSDHSLQHTVEDPPSSSSPSIADSIPLRTSKKKKQTAATIMKSSSSSNISNSSSISLETLLNQPTSATTTWHLRSAYTPTTLYEQQLLQSLGGNTGSSSSSADNTNNNKVNTIMSGLNMAQNSEVKVCHSLKRIAEILCVSERRMGRRQLLHNMNMVVSSSSKYNNSVMMDTPVRDDEDEEHHLLVAPGELEK